MKKVITLLATTFMATCVYVAVRVWHITKMEDAETNTYYIGMTN